MEYPILENITVKPMNVTKCKKNENKLFIIIIIIIIIVWASSKFLHPDDF